MNQFKIGIDLGGTKTEGILLDSGLLELKRIRVSTPAADGYAAIVECIVQIVEDLEVDLADSATVGIGTPGAISAETMRVKNSNTQCLIGQPLKEDLESRLDRPVKMENDANCFILAEQMMGAAKGSRLSFGVIMGTGVGGGIAIEGRIWQGANHIAGEWGHIELVTNGNRCYCGKQGCVETYLSGPALERSWKSVTGREMILKDIVEYCEQGSDEKAAKWKNQHLEHFGEALSKLINVLDPEVVVLGGGVSNIPWLYDEAIPFVHKYVFSDSCQTRIVRNQLGDSAGVIGAALL